VRTSDDLPKSLDEMSVERQGSKPLRPKVLKSGRKCRTIPIRGVLRFGEKSILQAYRAPSWIDSGISLGGRMRENGRISGLSPYRSTKPHFLGGRERNWDRTFSKYVCVVRRTTTQTDPFAPAPLVTAISQLSHTIRLLDSLFGG